MGFDRVLHVLKTLGVCADDVFRHSAASCGDHSESNDYPVVTGGGVIVESG